MTKKSILEEALMEAEELENMIKSQSKDVLRSIMSEEINDFIKSTLMEEEDPTDELLGDEAEEEDAPDMDDVADDELPAEMPDVEDVPVDDEEGDEDEMEEPEDEDEMEEPEDEMEEPEEEEETEIDLTGADMDTVINVYRKLGPNDDIKVVQAGDNTVEISDEGTGAEYLVKLGGDLSESYDIDYMQEGELNEEDFNQMMAEMDMGMNEEYDDFDLPESVEIPADFKGGNEELELDDMFMEMDDMDMGRQKDDLVFDIDAMSDEPDYMGMNDMDMNEETLYEIELSEDSLCEGCGYKHDMGGDEFYMEENFNLSEFDELDLDDEEDEDTLEERARTLPNSKGNPAHNLHAWNKEIGESYEHLKTQNQLLESKVDEYKNALQMFKDKLSEVAVFNSNLTHVTRLFTENATSKKEKMNILKRFDDVKTINESKTLYNSIQNELDNNGPINESVNKVVNKTPQTSKSKQLNESVAFVDPKMRTQLDRMKELMGLNNNNNQ